MNNELMTVRMTIPAVPEPTGNLDEVQANIDSLLASYTGRVYTAEEIKSAKADRAQVNKWDKQLAEAAQAIKERYLSAIERPLDRISNMRKQVKQVSGTIDRQIKSVEETEREEKRQALEGIYRSAAEELAPLIPFEKVLEPRWLNKTTSLETASWELRKSLERRREELRVIRTTCSEDAEPCITEYLRELSLNAALNEYSRRKDARAAQERARAAKEAAMQARAIAHPTEEERTIRAEAAQEARASAVITPEGRLDVELLRRFSEPQKPARRRYQFWVDFTQEDIAWFRAAAAERGFAFGSIK